MQHTYPATEFLLVDDDPSISEFLATYLSERGHPSNATIEGNKAPDCLSESRCDGVGVELNLPNVSAIYLIASVRAGDPRLPIVASSEMPCGAADRRPPRCASWCG